MKNILLFFLLLPLLSYSQLSVNNDLEYNYIHAVGSADSLTSVSIGGTQNIYYKVNTSGAMSWHECNGLTCAGDSIRIITPGHYLITPMLSITTSNINDVLRIKLYKNGSALPTSLGRWIINSQGAGLGSSRNFFWYYEFSKDDYLSVRITNQTGSRAITINDFKLLIQKIPEN